MHYAIFEEISSDKLQDIINFGMDQMGMRDDYEGGTPPQVIVEEVDRVKYKK